jgi:hypothetical protein
MILDREAIEADLSGRNDSDYSLDNPERGSIVIPITRKHLALAVNYFSNNWRPGSPLNFRNLSRLSACDPSRPAFDFTADGIEAGQKLSPKQIRGIFQLWLAERSSRLTEEV